MARPLLTLALVVSLTAPSAAVAQAAGTNAPPGNSAIDEYLETIPSAGGDTHPGPASGGGTGTSGDGGHGALTPSGRRQLVRLGPDGVALARLVDATATSPAPAAGVGRVLGARDASSPATSPADVPAVRPPSVVRATLVAATTGGGSGMVLPAFLGASLLGVIAMAVMRRRPAR